MQEHWSRSIDQSQLFNCKILHSFIELLAVEIYRNLCARLHEAIVDDTWATPLKGTIDIFWLMYFGISSVPNLYDEHLRLSYNIYFYHT